MPKIIADVVLCDIEGTTTSISFVKDVLFPYAVKHSKKFLEDNWNEVYVKEIVSSLVALPEFQDFQGTLNITNDVTVEIIANFVTYLIEKDLKLGPLKSLQGLVWNQGYMDKSLKGHIYEDVPAAFKKWTDTGAKICIYSSGSIKAQKLLFGHSDFADLTLFLSEYFDTGVGNKRQAQSYKNILKSLDISGERVVFLTDIIEEGEAAREAGVQVIILDRPGNAALSDDNKKSFTIVKNFNEIEINLS